MSKKNKKNKRNKTNELYYETPFWSAFHLISIFGFFAGIGLLVHMIDVEKNQKPKQVQSQKIK